MQDCSSAANESNQLAQTENNEASSSYETTSTQTKHALMRVAILGGSFDPPTISHLQVSR